MLTRRLFVDRIGDEIALHEQAQTQLAKLDGALPSGRLLADLAGNGQVNLASRVLYEALRRDARHGPFINAVDRSPARAQNILSAPLIVIVPGMFYRQYPEIGADGKLLTEIAARFGVATTVLPTASLGSVSNNVEILHAHLSSMPPRPFWLVSMSRGSAEVKWLLQTYPNAPYLRQLGRWISLCGIPSGTPLHEGIHASRILRALHRTLARVNGVSPALSEELRASNAKWQPTSCPEHVRVINLIAIPLSWHITASAVRRYQRLCHLGPTDGVLLLAEYLKEPGLIYPLWGVDHFMRTSRIVALFYRLFYYLLVAKGGNSEKPDNIHSIDIDDLGNDGAGPTCR